MNTTKHNYTNEADGSLVIDGVVVCSPCAEFPADAMRELVRAANDRPHLLSIAARVVELWTPETGRRLERLLGTFTVNKAAGMMKAAEAAR